MKTIFTDRETGRTIELPKMVSCSDCSFMKKNRCSAMKGYKGIIGVGYCTYFKEKEATKKS